MATFAETHAHHAPAGTGTSNGRVFPTKWTTRYIDSREASSSFAQCVDEHGDLHVIEDLWTLIKTFMVWSDEDMEVLNGMCGPESMDAWRKHYDSRRGGDPPPGYSGGKE